MELLAFGFLAFVALAVFGLFASVIAMVLWVITLPFRLLGLVFHGLGALLALPFLILFAVIAAVVFGFAAIAFLLPALPIVLAALAIWWIFGRRSRPSPIQT
jgi:hypothetical protein